MKITYTLFLLGVAYLPGSYAQNPQPTAQPTPATKQAPCGPSDSFDKHVKLKTPPKLKAQLAKMLGQLGNKTGIVINPDDLDPSKLTKQDAKPCPAPSVAPATPPANQAAPLIAKP